MEGPTSPAISELRGTLRGVGGTKAGQRLVHDNNRILGLAIKASFSYWSMSSQQVTRPSHEQASLGARSLSWHSDEFPSPCVRIVEHDPSAPAYSWMDEHAAGRAFDVSLVMYKCNMSRSRVLMAPITTVVLSRNVCLHGFCGWLEDQCPDLPITMWLSLCSCMASFSCRRGLYLAWLSSLLEPKLCMAFTPFTTVAMLVNITHEQPEFATTPLEFRSEISVEIFPIDSPRGSEISHGPSEARDEEDLVQAIQIEPLYYDNGLRPKPTCHADFRKRTLPTVYIMALSLVLWTRTTRFLTQATYVEKEGEDKGKRENPEEISRSHSSVSLRNFQNSVQGVNLGSDSSVESSSRNASETPQNVTLQGFLPSSSEDDRMITGRWHKGPSSSGSAPLYRGWAHILHSISPKLKDLSSETRSFPRLRFQATMSITASVVRATSLMSFSIESHDPCFL
ncbi:hypothetical protein VNO77_19453 [Canavalia gladiata]|uniref:Uncharacterized protein n=1 Tax=Canavalia gladiata TaxID=3824 RepID=A0AAN9LMT0_CANGL